MDDFKHQPDDASIAYLDAVFAHIDPSMPSDELLDFRAEVLAATFEKLLAGTFFSICDLDSAYAAVSALTGPQDRPVLWPDKDKTPMEREIYPAFRALHCTHYSEMSPKTRSQLPAAILAYCGLDDTRGEVLCGVERWKDVKQAYAEFAVSKPYTESEPEPDALSGFELDAQQNRKSLGPAQFFFMMLGFGGLATVAALWLGVVFDVIDITVRPWW
nr:hypothetical protein 24.0 kDa [uncultured bacterium]